MGSAASRTLRRLAYLGVPVVFCVLGYAVLAIAFAPVWRTASSLASLFIASEAPNFNSKLSVIYDPNAIKADVASDQTIDGSTLHFPEEGEQYGQITCERIGLDCPVFWYDSDEILDNGAGQSIISKPAGYGSLILLAGHNMTDFNCLQYAEVGDVIKFGTNYCDYEYTIRQIEVWNENDLEELLSSKATQDYEELIMYTCYPFYAISGRKTDRLVVFADRTAGLDVKWKEG